MSFIYFKYVSVFKESILGKISLALLANEFYF